MNKLGSLESVQEDVECDAKQPGRCCKTLKHARGHLKLVSGPLVRPHVCNLAFVIVEQKVADVSRYVVPVQRELEHFVCLIEPYACLRLKHDMQMG